MLTLIHGMVQIDPIIFPTSLANPLFDFIILVRTFVTIRARVIVFVYVKPSLKFSIVFGRCLTECNFCVWVSLPTLVQGVFRRNEIPAYTSC